MGNSETDPASFSRPGDPSNFTMLCYLPMAIPLFRFSFDLQDLGFLYHHPKVMPRYEYKRNKYRYKSLRARSPAPHGVQGEGRGNLTPSQPSPLGGCVVISLRRSETTEAIPLERDCRALLPRRDRSQ